MSVKELIPLILGVLKDFRVIGTLIVMLVVIEFARFVTNYTKKAPRPKIAKSAKKSAPAPAPAEAPAEEASSENSGGE